ncbi:MAG: TM2 domain-containing protein [Deltaproteobacteria bacterium]|jgi:hypothetical protein|nr:TM2 domain-containing protein [Deltaproteobacteria bacterium]
MANLPKRTQPKSESQSGGFMDYSPKSRFVALLLCWFLGLFGAHRYYTGKIWTGIIMLLTGGGFVIWWIIDLVMILVGEFDDKQKRRLFRWFEPDSV